MNKFWRKIDIGNLHKNDLNGKGQTICIIDTGIKPHIDFCMPKNRIKSFFDIDGKIIPYDNNGHGTAVCGIAAGNGFISNGKFIGVAPRADIVAIRAISDNGIAKAKDIINAIKYILENKELYKISIVCMSFGSDIMDKKDPLLIGAETLWKSGIIVVASAGNSGPEYKTISSPGASPSIITVGALNWTKSGNMYVPSFSSKGPYFNYSKPDIVAPAVNIESCGARDDFYVRLTGTSMAAPIVAGLCLLIKQKFPNITPNEVKKMIIDNATIICDDKNVCGHGAVNVEFLLN